MKLVTSNGELFSWVTVVFCWPRLSHLSLLQRENLRTVLPYVWLQPPISPFLGHSAGLHLHVRGLTLSSTARQHVTDPTFTSSSHPIQWCSRNLPLRYSEPQLSSKSMIPSHYIPGRSPWESKIAFRQQGERETWKWFQRVEKTAIWCSVWPSTRQAQANSFM